MKTSVVKSYLELAPKFDDMVCSLQAAVKQPKGILKEIREVVAIARKFNETVVRPDFLDIEKKIHEDPDYVPVEWFKAAGRWGFYTLWMPKMFGGKGYCFPSLAYFVEEIGSVCLGMGNLIGVHYLGLSMLMASWNTRVIRKICKEVVSGEKSDRPCTISFALTEPGSGTDTAETELLDRAAVACHAKKVAGGYELSGTKVFISNALQSTWHMVIAFSDLEKPSENGVFLAVKAGAEGFSLGKKENKMGQKACPVNELVFDACFVPDEQVCMDRAQMKSLSRSPGETYQQVLDFVVSTTRAAVCAFGAGVARGAFEEALKFAAETEVEGRLLINHEWAQGILADMHKNIIIARLLYTEANYANGMYGFFKALQAKPAYYLFKFLPGSLLSKMIYPFLGTRMATRMFRKLQLDAYSEVDMNRITTWSSLAKFAGSDAGIKNCQMALELMGQAGLRHGNKVEKYLRDAKLLQIYEGTNQLNRLILFRSLTRYRYSQATVFHE
jgi:acyl-CoA dehydrogenase